MNNALVNWVKQHDLLTFFLMTFVFFWPKAIADAAYSVGQLPNPPSSALTWLALLGTPLIAALLVSAVTCGKPGLKEWAARLFRWRVGWQWYLFVLLVYPLVAATAYTVSDLIAGRAWSVTTMWKAGFENLRVNAVELGLNPENTWQIFVVLVMVSFLVPIFEEAGWRAFAIPRLQEKYGALIAGLIMGVIWAVWHLPNFFTKGTDHYGMPFTWFLLTITAGSVLMVWIMNNTNQSVLMTILLHGSIILAGHFLPTQLAYQTGDYVAFWLTCAFLVVIAIGVVWRYGPQLKRDMK